MITVSTQDVPLSAAPIRADWVIEGMPCARNAVLARSADRTTMTLVWDCTSGRFRWDYDQDETVHIIEGGATLTMQDGRVEHLKAGDIVFFPAGSTAVWNVSTYVRKFAVFRETVPAPVAFYVRLKAKVRTVLAARGRPAAAAQGWITSQPEKGGSVFA